MEPTAELEIDSRPELEPDPAPRRQRQPGAVLQLGEDHPPGTCYECDRRRALETTVTYSRRVERYAPSQLRRARRTLSSVKWPAGV